MAESFNVPAAVGHLVKHSQSSSQHSCAKYVRQAMEAGGINTSTRPNWAWKYIQWLPSQNFNEVAVLHTPDQQSGFGSSAGDIAVYMKPGAGTSQPGHICMYTGSQWISDFRQRAMNVYKGATDVHVFRFGGERTEGDMSGLDFDMSSDLNGVGGIGSSAQCGGYRIGECPQDIKFKRLWNMYREKFGQSTGSTCGGGNIDVGALEDLQLDGDTVTYKGVTMTKSYLDMVHRQESGQPFGSLPDNLIKGKDIGDYQGAKTYGAGLLFDPLTGQLMDKTRAKQGRDFTLEELEDRFLTLYTNNIKKAASKLGGISLTPNQAEALSSTVGLFGHVPSGIAAAIKKGDFGKPLLDAWMHAHDSDSKYSKFRGGWDARSMWEYLWFIGKFTPGFDSCRGLVKQYFSTGNVG